MRETIQDELIMLLGYETDGGRHSVLWDYPQYFHSRTGQGGKELDQRFDDWMRTKRTIQKEELFDGMWKKIADHGYAFVLRFLPDGTFIEHNISSEQNVGHGTWQQLGPVIRTWVGQMEGDQKAHYVLSMIANKTGQIHSAVEQRNGRPNAYFKMIHSLASASHKPWFLRLHKQVDGRRTAVSHSGRMFLLCSISANVDGCATTAP